MAGHPVSNEILLGAQGRLVIPAALRKSLRLKQGDRLVARQEDGALVLEPRETIERRLWKMFSHIPKEVNLVDELIAERRLDAEREENES